MRPTKLESLAAAATLLLACLALHYRALAAGFSYDDPVHLKFAATYAPWQYFTDKTVMLLQSYAHVTPWNALFFDLGLPLARLDARWHHAHLLTIIWACAFGTWGLLVRWTGRDAALFASTLFLAAPTTAVVGSLLMTGHYAYGLLFSILALRCHVHALLTRRSVWAIASACFYALACLCKELYVPLILILVSFPLANLTWRIRVAMPALAVAALYVGLRVHVLGGLGGYAALTVADVPSAPDPWGVAERFAQSVRAHLFGPGWAGVLAMSLAVGVLAIAILRGRRISPVLFGASATALLAPVLPVFAFDLPYGAGRVLFVIGWTLALAVGWSLRDKRAWLPAVAILALLIFQQRGEFERTHLPERVASQQYDFLTRASTEETLVPAGFNQHGYLDAMSTAVQLVLGRGTAQVIDNEGEMLNLASDRRQRAWAWSEASQSVAPMGPRFEQAVAMQVAARRAALGLPLEGFVSIQAHDRYRLLRWEVKSSPGRVFLHVDGYARLEVPPSGALAFGMEVSLSSISDPATVTVLVATPAGAMIQSRPIKLALNRNNRRSLEAE